MWENFTQESQKDSLYPDDKDYVPTTPRAFAGRCPSGRSHLRAHKGAFPKEDILVMQRSALSHKMLKQKLGSFNLTGAAYRHWLLK